MALVAMFFTGLMQALVFCIGIVIVMGLGLLTILILGFFLSIFRFLLGLVYKTKIFQSKEEVIDVEVETKNCIFEDTRRR